VFLLDEPTKGIDIGAKNAILQTIQHKLTKTGGIIMTSPSVEDLMLICNTILVLHNGRILRKFSRDEFDLNQIYLAIQGVASIPEDEQSDQLDV
jgi:ABC-type sugar transport system ATPase subunit